MRNSSGTRRRGVHRFATVMAAVGALLVSSGIALMATAGPSTAADGDCVPTDAYTDTTDWVATSPGTGWYQVASRVKTAATADSWTNLVWHNYAGNQPPSDEPPALTDGNWHVVQGDPQSANHMVPPRVPNVPYNVSNENNGRGSWYLWTGTLVPGSDAVMEYQFAFDHPAVTCEVTPPVVEPPTTPEVIPPKAPTAATPEVKAETTTPTVVHAGLVGTTDTGVRAGLSLSLAGLVLIAGAAGLVLPREGERREAA